MTGTTHRNTSAESVEEGVGLTALMVAAARAIETHRHDSLAQDVYAEHFVLAAPASASWPVHLRQVPEGDTNPLWGRFARYFGLRTRVLDDFLLQSVHEGGIRQVVLFGAGLDARAFRLDWPPGCVVFEIDREGVLEFKHQVLGGLSAAPKAARVPIPIDLRADWVGALTAAGFDTAAPTVWLAEGLLFYLPFTAEVHLIDTVDRLSTGEVPWRTRSRSKRTCWNTATARCTPLRSTRSASTCSPSSTEIHGPTPRVSWAAGAGTRRFTPPSTSPTATDAARCPNTTTRWKATVGCSRTGPTCDSGVSRSHPTEAVKRTVRATEYEVSSSRPHDLGTKIDEMWSASAWSPADPGSAGRSPMPTDTHLRWTDGLSAPR